jgi:hypothetical protein
VHHIACWGNDNQLESMSKCGTAGAICLACISVTGLDNWHSLKIALKNVNKFELQGAQYVA